MREESDHWSHDHDAIYFYVQKPLYTTLLPRSSTSQVHKIITKLSNIRWTPHGLHLEFMELCGICGVHLESMGECKVHKNLLLVFDGDRVCGLIVTVVGSVPQFREID